MARYTDAHKRAQRRYRASTKSMVIRFTNGEMALYEHARAQENTAAYIKDLISRDILRHKNK